MTRDEIRTAILSALADIAPETDPSTLAPRASLREELDIDSMDCLRLVAAIHKETGVDVPESDYPQIRTLDGCIEYLARRLGA